jgi:putative ABC transport system permease protein
MSIWSRIANVFRADRMRREIEEELESHIAEAVERGQPPAEAKMALGSALRHREASRDIRVLGWLDSLRSDGIFGWRQLQKNKVSSGAAILSLALAIGACTSAFRLIDALFLRPLPVAGAERLYVATRQAVSNDGKPFNFDGCEYPLFRRIRAAVQSDAELIAISYSAGADLTYRSDQEMEKAQLQYVSGWMFSAFGLRPALGRLLTEADDRVPGAQPYAVLTHAYWSRRFNRDPSVLGSTFRMGKTIYEIVGVTEEKFTGTEPGTMVDIMVPTMMHTHFDRPGSTWVRAFVQLYPRKSAERVRAQAQAVLRVYQQERANGFVNDSKLALERFLNQKLELESASSGMSGLQRDYRLGMAALSGLVALVLLIACVNVGGLMVARATARAREMALRVSLGAGRRRLVQLVLVESAWIAFVATAIGGAFAWWAAPFVMSLINPPDNPVRLLLPIDWRFAGFSLLLACSVTFFFGLAPAIRASGVKPVSALKGGENPHSRGRMMQALILAQVSFCFVVLLLGRLFVTTLDHLAHQPTGIVAEGVLTLSTVATSPREPVYWDQVAAQLRTVPGVQSVAISDRPLLDGTGWNNFIAFDGGPPSETVTHFRAVSPGWLRTMKIPLLDGRDFRAEDHYPGIAMVNQTFAKTYLNGRNPVGSFFEIPGPGGKRSRFQIIGATADARYRNLREPILPVAYFPLSSVNDAGKPEGRTEATFIVRTSLADPTTLAPALRREVGKTRSEFRVSNVRTQIEWIHMHTVRERLFAALALFFACVALTLSGVGLYGILDYSVVQRRREIGIRLAIGASVQHVVVRVTAPAMTMVLCGMLVGVGLSLAVARSIRAILFDVRASDTASLAMPTLMILGIAFAASLPAIIRTVRIDPAKMLRLE